MPLQPSADLLAGLPALRKLTMSGEPSSRVDRSLSQMTNLTALELWPWPLSGLPAGCLPASLRSLWVILSGRAGPRPPPQPGALLLPAVAACTGLEFLGLEGHGGGSAGLRRLTRLTQLILDTYEAGVPGEVRASFQWAIEP